MSRRTSAFTVAAPASPRMLIGHLVGQKVHALLISCDEYTSTRRILIRDIDPAMEVASLKFRIRCPGCGRRPDSCRPEWPSALASR